jgi:hypothetical protein
LRIGFVPPIACRSRYRALPILLLRLDVGGQVGEVHVVVIALSQQRLADGVEDARLVTR